MCLSAGAGEIQKCLSDRMRLRESNGRVVGNEKLDDMVDNLCWELDCKLWLRNGQGAHCDKFLKVFSVLL